MFTRRNRNKFDDERAIYAVVLSAARQAIGAHNMTPAIDFNADVNIINKLSNATAQSKEVYFEERFNSGLSHANHDHWQKIFEGEEITKPIPVVPVPAVQTLRFESALNQSTTVTEEKACFQIHNRYIVKQVRSGMMIVDQQAAHERICLKIS